MSYKETASILGPGGAQELISYEAPPLKMGVACGTFVVDQNLALDTCPANARPAFVNNQTANNTLLNNQG